MEFYIDVWLKIVKADYDPKQTKQFTLLLLLMKRKSGRSCPLIPETEEEIKRFDGALRRKQLSLVLVGKMKPHGYGVESIVCGVVWLFSINLKI
jgi:hypothetical protein